MRPSRITVALIALVVGADAISAIMVGANRTDIASFAAGPAMAQDVTVGRNDTFRSQRSLALATVDGPAASRKLRHNVTRLAQAASGVSFGDITLPPFTWAGALETPTTSAQERDPDSSPWCTAQFIAASVLLTAGHCLKDLEDDPTTSGYDLTKAVFVLQYHDNGEGTRFRVKCGRANPEWKYPKGYKQMGKSDRDGAYWTAVQHDFAMVLVDGISPTGHISYALDWKGKFKYAVRIGYPEDILGGNRIMQMGGPISFPSDSGVHQFDFKPYPNVVAQLGSTDQLSYGSSGGAWIATDPTTKSPTLIAVDSGGGLTDFPPSEEFAAYLTAREFNPLLESVSNGCK
jgi:hypothetical protein